MGIFRPKTEEYERLKKLAGENAKNADLAELAAGSSSRAKQEEAMALLEKSVGSGQAKKLVRSAAQKHYTSETFSQRASSALKGWLGNRL